MSAGGGPCPSATGPTKSSGPSTYPSTGTRPAGACTSWARPSSSPRLAFAVLLSPWWLLAAPLAGYGFAWVGHFFFEKNRPATFTYPLWSLRGDFRMYRLMLIGKMQPEIERASAMFPAAA